MCIVRSTGFDLRPVWAGLFCHLLPSTLFIFVLPGTQVCHHLKLHLAQTHAFPYASICLAEAKHSRWGIPYRKSLPQKVGWCKGSCHFEATKTVHLSQVLTEFRTGAAWRQATCWAGALVLFEQLALQEAPDAVGALPGWDDGTVRNPVSGCPPPPPPPPHHPHKTLGAAGLKIGSLHIAPQVQPTASRKG